MKYLIAILSSLVLTSTAYSEPVFVGPHNFVRAETDRYMRAVVDRGELGSIFLGRQPTDLENQGVIRMNLDTLYSSGVFDMEAGPVTVTLPDAPDGRYISAQILTQDHLTVDVYHGGTHTFAAEDVGTRYAAVVIRIFADSFDQDDIAYANSLQDLIEVSQPERGEFITPDYDRESLDATRMALLHLGALARGNFGVRMGSAEEVDPVSHLIVTAFGWGLLPEAEAAYFSGRPEAGTEDAPHELILANVPANAFWSVTMYNDRGFMVPNEIGVNALNNVNAAQSADGSYRIQLGGCEEGVVNCIPTPAGWNYIVRAYQPGEEITSGAWRPPAATPIE